MDFKSTSRKNDLEMLFYLIYFLLNEEKFAELYDPRRNADEQFIIMKQFK